MKNTKNYLTSKGLVAGLLISFAWAGCQPAEITTSVSPTQSSARLNAGKDYVDGEMLIQFAEGVSDEVKQKAFDKVKGQPIEKILTKAMERASKKEGLLLVKVNKNVLEAVADLQGASGVEFAEPNFIYQHTATATDTYYASGQLWGMKGGFGSNAEAAWAAGYTGSATVYVGVIDEGIQFDHPDLAGQVSNPGTSADIYVNDTYGWDFANNDNTVYDGGKSGGSDDHGTHVSGTIGGKANGTGVVGVNWNVKLISAKFLGRNGGTTANAVKAVDYLTTLKDNGVNIVASNNSWGGGGYSQALYDAIKRADTAGILFVAAAGNSGANNDVTASYPSNYDLPNVIAVAAIDRNGGLASFSQYGKVTVDLGAPGVAIISTTAVNSYSSYGGTSMATPHVTGAVALYKSKYPSATAAQIRTAILTSTVPTASLNGKTVTGGRLDANAALSK